MPKPDPRVIKRYANRKLYDTVTRQFTTLSELAVLIEGGTPVVVKDHDTGRDLTEDVLTQVLGRRLKGSAGNTDALTGLLRGSTDAALKLSTGLLGGLAASEPEPAPAPAPAPNAKGKKKSGGKKNSDKAAAKSGAKSGAAKPKKPADEETPEQREIRELRAQVTELTAAVSILVQKELREQQGDA